MRWLPLLFTLVSARPQSNPTPKRCFKTLAPLPKARQEHSVVAVDSNVYVIGGLLNGEPTDSVAVYDTLKNTWSETTPLPTAYHHANVAAVDGKVYVLGGINNKTGWKSNPASWRYDPRAAEKRWEPVAPMTFARGSAVVGVRGKTVWLAGGLETKPDPDPKSSGSISMQTVAGLAAYDSVSDKWVDYVASPLPGILDHAGGGVIGDTFYVFQGRTAGPTTNQQATYALNVSSVPPTKWEKLEDSPSRRGGIGVAVVGTSFYSFGGEGNSADPSGTYANIETFDTVTRKWKFEADMKVPRHGFGAASVGDMIFLPGGGTKQGSGSSVDINESYGSCA